MANLQKKESRLTFITQTVFGRKAKALYRCACGTIKEIQISNVKRGTTYSCGCYKKEQDVIHGLYQHPLYKVWIGIKQRCYYINSISYPNYGAKGVVMCDEWLHNPKAFIEWGLKNGWEKGLQIDKDLKAKELGLEALLYSPERCQFVTPKINSNERKNSRFIEFNGKTQTIQQWSEELGILNATLTRRIQKHKWPIEKAILTPVKIYAARKRKNIG
jgi:hypothetical protein